MPYLYRHAENKLRDMAAWFRVLLVTGARQVGKSTLLEHVFPEIRSFVFDPIQDLYGARRDPDLFLDNFPSPLILDEIQYAPELLPAIKRRVDRSEAKGQYLLTGSQHLGALKAVAESLAGRMGMLALEPMTLEEILGSGDKPVWLSDYLSDPDSLPDLAADWTKAQGTLPFYLWRGCLPGTLELPDRMIPEYFKAYISTYVERDVLTIENIRGLTDFDRFLHLSAALTAQEINASQLGREVGVTPATARRWLDLLHHTFQWLELSPYHGNTIKRLSGKSKGFLRDTGMICYLQRISSPDSLAVSPLLGQIFETWVINMICRYFITLDMPPQTFHWRTNGGAEVDLVLERDGRLYPIEVKCKTVLSGHDLKGIRAFRETYADQPLQTGLIIYAGEICYRPDPHIIALPWNLLPGLEKKCLSF